MVVPCGDCFTAKTYYLGLGRAAAARAGGGRGPGRRAGRSESDTPVSPSHTPPALLPLRGDRAWPALLGGIWRIYLPTPTAARGTEPHGYAPPLCLWLVGGSPIYKLHELKLGVEWPFRRYEAAFWRK